ncbi:glycosyl transferase [Pseudaminobacter arsenicus]|uniref:Glycosyl transferase n=1 Tax=Borborobacter arsenicus TaxID=1851146 RepID=A0A432V9N5_9HYPH|nr:glycosyltransferase family 2 protein [Pseudaminobacter arsenicus]RUM98881.1 glycosyl transferase [Pseudaminobacter arsenicus]
MVAVEARRATGTAATADGAKGFHPELENANENGISLFGALVLPEITAWRPVLDRLGISVSTCIGLASRAGGSGSSFQAELLASGIVTEAEFYHAVAQELGVAFEADPDPQKLVMRQVDGLALLRRGGHRMAAQLEDGRGGLGHLAAPDVSDWQRLRRCLHEKPALRHRIRIVAPSELRQAILWRSREALTRLALTSLYEQRPDCSARYVVNAYQAFALGLLIGAIPLAMLLAPKSALVALHIVLSLFFSACVALRVAAIFWLPPPSTGSLPAVSRDIPVYSVLVALDKEAEVVPDLLVGLSRINWPAGKLEIKLVCEEDDADTIHAIMNHPLGARVEIIVVPDTQPRTKPKALSYALPLTSGEFIVLYDAEDRPHPMQLMEAWQRFRDSGPGLGCLQAPLEVSNRGAGMIANMFGFEYAALFRRLLPWLAANRLMFPLGGTSNHFRRSVLEEVGGWDPYNVTEDADLGLRLARFGYRAETISCPTLEDGPEDFRTWRLQRMRWFKGWMQTWLVHMRAPARLASELPLASFCLAQILFAGMVLSALLHPFLFLSALLLMVQSSAGVPLGGWQKALLVFDSVNVTLGYLSFMVLGGLALSRQERKGYWKVCLFTPVYWLMLSIAAWCALYELCKRPHHWNKTPHRRSQYL